MRVGSVEDVSEQLTLFVAVIVFSNDGQRHWVRTRLDTGFDGGLTLPGEMIDALNLKYLNETLARLANGTVYYAQTYRIRLLWKDEIQETEVYRMDSAPLLGTDMMRGTRIEFDATHLGEILAKPIVQNINSA